MSEPKHGEFYSMQTLLGGPVDRNKRMVYRWPSDKVIAVFNPHVDEWTPELEYFLTLTLEALNSWAPPLATPSDSGR